MLDVDLLSKQLNRLEKSVLKPFKSWDKKYTIYPSGIPDKSFPGGYEGEGSKYVHPKSGEEQVFRAITTPPTKTSFFDPRTGYTHVKMEDLKKQLDIFITKLEKLSDYSPR